MNSFKTQFIPTITNISPQEWNALTGRATPFLRHEFLHALEQSGSASPDTGWTPAHYTLRDDTGRLIAAAPAYLKDHSYGEYVFDWSWAHAYQENRLRYYPKLLTAVPFTPSVGPRLRLHPDFDSAALTHRYITDTLTYCQQNHLSSWHLLFPNPTQDQLLSTNPTLMKRIGVQYHWYNYNYHTFADYLGQMKARKRNAIRKERAKVAAQGITFEHLTGRDLTPAHLHHFYLFYHATYMKRGQYGYLNQEFFTQLAETMPDSLMIIFANKNGRHIAAALFFLSNTGAGGDTLYGRYWGSLDDYNFLHFETCYYQGIDYAIAHNLHHFDSGAQGEHKIQRGFEPIQTTSYHYIAHPLFADAIQDFLHQENPHINQYIQEAQTLLPFKSTSPIVNR